MPRFLRLQVCGFAAALSALFLFSCDKKSEEAHCKQIESLFAMDNWDSLATGPIKPDKPFDGLELYDAPASSMIAGGVKCRIMRTINSFAETLTYGCNIPVTDSVVNDSDIALKAFVAPWRSCVAGWEEVPAPRPKPLDAEIMLSEIMFSEGEKALSFSTSIKPIRYDNIGLIKVKIKR